jgi:uncharacterized Zn finger protein
MVKDLIYCPKCGDHKVKSVFRKEKDFDGEGWYRPIENTCEIRVCGHVWLTKAHLQRL